MVWPEKCNKAIVWALLLCGSIDSSCPLFYAEAQAQNAANAAEMKAPQVGSESGLVPVGGPAVDASAELKLEEEERKLLEKIARDSEFLKKTNAAAMQPEQAQAALQQQAAAAARKPASEGKLAMVPQMEGALGNISDPFASEVQLRPDEAEISPVNMPKSRVPAGAGDGAAARLEKQLEEARAQLGVLSRVNRDLKQQLEEKKNRLMIAETEVDRLSRVLEERNRSSLARYGGAPSVTNIQARPAPVVPTPRPAAREPVVEDMPIATVVVEKANLRTGPGKDNSILLSVSKGTRLAVELRNGEWYRVVSPTGQRAWVSSDMLAFGRGDGSAPARTLKNGGISSGGRSDEGDLEPFGQ